MSGCVLDLVSDYTAVVDSDMPIKDKALKVNEGPLMAKLLDISPLKGPGKLPPSCVRIFAYLRP